MLRYLIAMLLVGCEAPCEGLYTDADGDGFGDPASTPTDCTADTVVTNRSDCDDSEPTAYPGGTEVFYDGIDQDCLGLDDEWDQDRDGYTVAQAPEPSASFDCVDTDPTIHPGLALNIGQAPATSATLPTSQTPWIVDSGPELRLGSDQSGDQHHPSIALGGDDSFVLAWQSGVATSARVFTQRFDLNGDALGDRFELNDLAETGGKPDIESNGDGYWATWQDNRGSIYLRHLSADGSPSGPSTVVYESNHAAEGPDLALRPDGTVVVVWNVDDIPGEQGRDYYRIYDTEGMPLTEPIVAAITGRSVADVAPLSDGSFVLVGTNKDSPPPELLSEVYGRVIGPDHCVTPFRVDQGLTLNPSRPAVAASQDGSFVVTWRNKVSRDEGDGVFGRLFDAQGRALTEQFTLMEAPNNATRSVARYVGTDLFLSWQATLTEPAIDIVTAAIDAGPSTSAAPFTQNVDETFHHERPVMDAVADGSDRILVLAWESERPSGGMILGRVSTLRR